MYFCTRRNDILWLTQFVTDQNKEQKLCKTVTERTVKRATEGTGICSLCVKDQRDV